MTIDLIGVYPLNAYYPVAMFEDISMAANWVIWRYGLEACPLSWLRPITVNILPEGSQPAPSTLNLFSATETVFGDDGATAEVST